MTTHRDSLLADYAVVGLGVSGLSCLRFLRARGASLIALDTRESPPGLEAARAIAPDADIVTGPLDASVLCRCANIVVSPGLGPDAPALVAAVEAGSRLIGDIELFAQAVAAPVVAITGTNGKSTVTALVSALLAGSGLDVRCGGNIGTPALDLIGATEPDCYVLEISSFQLQLTDSLRPRVAALLNITPDHLDRHGDFARYVAAKARILDGADCVVLNADDPVVAALEAPGRRVEFTLGASDGRRYGIRGDGANTSLYGPSGALIAVDDLPVHGQHNWANVLAALAIAEEMNVAPASVKDTLKGFKGLPHRAAEVGSVAGVRFVDDSKATNPGAAIATIQGLLANRRGVVICGGEPKGTGFEGLADCLAEHAHTVILMGRAAAAIETALRHRVPTVTVGNMDAAVQSALRVASSGDKVLLAPACASFDMFENYAARGDAFAQAVRDSEAIS